MWLTNLNMYISERILDASTQTQILIVECIVDPKISWLLEDVYFLVQ